MVITKEVIRDYLRNRSLDNDLVARKKEIDMLLRLMYPVKANLLTGMPSGNLIEKPVEKHLELLESLKNELNELNVLQTSIDLVAATLDRQEKKFYELRYGEKINTIKAVAIIMQISPNWVKKIDQRIIERILKKHRSKMNQYCLISLKL